MFEMPDACGGRNTVLVPASKGPLGCPTTTKAGAPGQDLTVLVKASAKEGIGIASVESSAFVEELEDLSGLDTTLEIRTIHEVTKTCFILEFW